LPFALARVAATKELLLLRVIKHSLVIQSDSLAKVSPNFTIGFEFQPLAHPFLSHAFHAPQ
jgi:hypothetical protein